MSDADNNLMAHDYDGIREYDNPTPGWWKLIFLGCCVWAVGYWFYYHGGPGLSESESYDLELAALEETRAAVAKAEGTLDDAQLLTMSQDSAMVEAGKQVFAVRCASCHKPTGEGLVGPNLTDDKQIHGTKPVDILNTIKVGVPPKGMVSWEPLLKPEELKSVTAFVVSLRNTNVPGGKPPEGNPIELLPEAK